MFCIQEATKYHMHQDMLLDSKWTESTGNAMECVTITWKLCIHLFFNILYVLNILTFTKLTIVIKIFLFI